MSLESMGRWYWSTARVDAFDRISLARPASSFSVLGQQVQIDCGDPALCELLAANFGAMAVPGFASRPSLRYSIEGDGRSRAFTLSCNGQPPREAGGPGDLLFLLEKDLIVELQQRRPELLFLHAAAIALDGQACLLAADSGCGKSTTAWALLHHAFSYLTDELSPVDLDRMEVLAYPHALCLKQQPPPVYALPAEAIDLGRTIHVPVRAMPGSTVCEARPIKAIFLLRYDPLLTEPKLQALSAAEAGARLYVTVLNALSHPYCGLDAVVHVARRIPCFALASADLPKTCALIRSSVERIATAARSRPTCIAAH